jgi:hypothetical protein
MAAAAAVVLVVVIDFKTPTPPKFNESKEYLQILLLI